MRLSTLQKYILRQSIQSRRTRFPRKEFMRFYEAMEQPPSLDDRQGGITKSLERLIDKGLMIGYGRRTPKKWFIDEIRLTPAGTKTARRLLGEQQKLPFRTIRTK